MINDDFYMDLAIKEAWKSQILSYPNPAVGCVILDKNGAILSINSHKKAGFLHAEANAILFALFKLKSEILDTFLKEYKQKLGVNINSINLENELLDAKFCYEFILKNHSNLLKNAKAYVTLEPCMHTGKTPPCASLIKELNFKEVVIGSLDENKIASGGLSFLKNANLDVKFGIRQQECKTLLYPFLKWQSGNFSFFKLALSANGVAKGGIISNEQSRTHSHKLRSLCDLLVIGGNTVRIDRPTLDTRLIENGKNPNVLIYSNSNDFDSEIPLFKVKSRSVKISNSLKNLNSKLTMYEGGENFLKLALNRHIPNLKWILLYQSHEFKAEQNVNLQGKIKKLFSNNIGDNSYGWYEII